MHTKTDLLKGNILKSLILFAIPLIISNLFQQLYNAADTMIVGHFLGDESLAAIGACAAVYELLVGFALGFGNGLSMVVARSFGVGDKNLLKRAVAGSLVIGAAVTVGVMLIAQIGLRPLLVLLHTPSEIIEESYSYIYIVTICVGVMFAYNLLSGLLRAIGNSFMPAGISDYFVRYQYCTGCSFYYTVSDGNPRCSSGNGGSTGNFCSIMCHLYYEKM